MHSTHYLKTGVCAPPNVDKRVPCALLTVITVGECAPFTLSMGVNVRSTHGANRGGCVPPTVQTGCFVQTIELTGEQVYMPHPFYQELCVLYTMW